MSNHNLKPLYRYYYKPKPRDIAEIERQRRILTISVVIITLECILGVGTIIYFATQ